MSNGLIMNIEEFRKLPQETKLDCLFENQVKTFEAIKGYKIFYKLTVIVNSFLSAGVVGLFYMLWEHIKGG